MMTELELMKEQEDMENRIKEYQEASYKKELEDAIYEIIGERPPVDKTERNSDNIYKKWLIFSISMTYK